MASRTTKSLFLLAFLLASAVLAAAATDQTRGKDEKVKTNAAAGVQDWHDGGGGGYPGGGGGGGYGPPRYCRRGCCRRGYHGGCERCCWTADEVPERTERPEVHN